MSTGAISKRQFKKTIQDLGEIVGAAGPHSALRGLTIVAVAFGALLDTYAAPNAENPEGMCDDPAAFRKYFAEMIEKGPLQEKKTA